MTTKNEFLLQEIENEKREVEMVRDTLKEVVGSDRKCFRMVGGVLVERTPTEVLSALGAREAFLTQTAATLKEAIKKDKSG